MIQGLYLRTRPMQHIGKELTWGLLPSPGGTLTTCTTSREWRRVRNFMMLRAISSATLCVSSTRKVASSAEEQAADAPQVNLPEEFRSKLNPEQMKSVGAMIAGDAEQRYFLLLRCSGSCDGTAQKWRSLRRASDCHNV